MKAAAVIIFIFLCGMLGGCMKRPAPDPSLRSSIVGCSGSNAWTIERLTTAVSGDWRIYQEENGMPVYENIALHFGSDNVLTVTKGNQLVGQAPFNIKTTNGTDFSIQTTGDGQGYVSGILYLCDRYMLCSLVTVDGPEYFYQRN